MVITNLLNHVLQLHARGYSVRDISTETGLSKSKVGRMLKEFKDSELGTAAGTRPTDAFEMSGTPVGTAPYAVPMAGWDAFGTEHDSENRAAAAAKLAREREELAVEALLRGEYKISLRDSYQNFLDNISTFLIMEFRNEESARSYIESRQERVYNIFKLANQYCLYCKVEIHELYMPYVIRELYHFLGQEPELEIIDRGVKIKAGVVLEQFIKQIDRIDIFTPMGDNVPSFPDIE